MNILLPSSGAKSKWTKEPRENKREDVEVVKDIGG
jgi:hypothetical protein